MTKLSHLFKRLEVGRPLEERQDESIKPKKKISSCSICGLITQSSSSKICPECGNKL